MNESYKLTGINGSIMELGKGAVSKWIIVRNVRSTCSVLDSLNQTPKSLKVKRVSKIRSFEVLKLCSTTVFLSWCQLDILKVMCGLHEM